MQPQYNRIFCQLNNDQYCTTTTNDRKPVIFKNASDVFRLYPKFTDFALIDRMSLNLPYVEKVSFQTDFLNIILPHVILWLFSISIFILQSPVLKDIYIQFIDTYLVYTCRSKSFLRRLGHICKQHRSRTYFGLFCIWSGSRIIDTRMVYILTK